jgi:hypothetical protein
MKKTTKKFIKKEWKLIVGLMFLLLVYLSYNISVVDSLVKQNIQSCNEACSNFDGFCSCWPNFTLLVFIIERAIIIMFIINVCFDGEEASKK